MNCWKILCGVLLFAFGAVMPTEAQVVSEKVDVLVIDPGHGGKDPGCVGKKAREKDVVLAVALKFGKMVKETFPDVKVVYTRSDDRFIELWKRGQIANDHHADLFISIHCNAAKSSTARGMETWLRGAQKDEANLAEVQRENAVIAQEQNHEKNYSQSWMDMVTATIHQDAGFENSVYFAQELQGLYKKNISASPDRGIKQGPFYVLWKSARPSILTELGFLSNPEEEKFLLSEEGQNTVARCMLNAFSKYKQRIDRRSEAQSNTVAEKAKAPEPAPVKEAPATPVVESQQPSINVQKPADTTQEEIRSESAAPEQTAQTKAEPKAEPQAEAKVEQSAPAADTAAAKPQSTIEFRVQLAASSNDLELKPYNFNGLTELSKYYDAEQSLYKYYYSSAPTIEGIRQAVQQAKDAGYSTAFVAAFENGRPVSLQEAIDKQKTN
ncbi:MAG: N-acetylmuramoyl-L-alanine amidase [Lentimicrobiaceae bacterium]|nr:N-acetylmuramoyl-L-alanine amidase [Lentimicrobiaceae bacterium]